MRTVETKVYTFDELSDEAKEKARNWWRDGDEMPLLSEDMNYKAEELLKENGIEADTFKVYYSLSHCQGDGAMIEFSGTWDDKHVTVKQYGRYSHEYSTDIEMYSENEEGDREYLDYKAFEEDVYVPMCRALRDWGYDCIEHNRSKDVVDELLILNGYEFTEDGEIF